MKVKDETMVQLYQMLGKVFYATAQADKVIRQEEIDTIKRLVKEDWLDVEDTFDEIEEITGSDSAYQIEIVVDYCYADGIILDNVLDDLKDFKKIHPRLFTPDLIELIMKTSYKIASSFAGRNKSELVFLSQLRSALEK